MVHANSFPHLVLGLSSHVQRNEAAAGFARASRRLRRMSDSPFTMEDLTAALSRVENNRDDKAIKFEYVLPADPRVHKTGLRLPLDVGVFSESDDLSELIGHPDLGKPPEAVGFLFLNAALSRIFLWEWAIAAAYARECLRLSRQEEVRDEALNVLAVSLAMQGDCPRAIDALRRAVEGRWTLGLQTNLLILAAEEDQELAIRQIAYLISGERDPERRLAACRLAIAMWEKFQEDTLGEAVDHDDPPDEILRASRQLLADSSLAEEDFYDLGSFLARIDPAALKHSRSIDVSPHRNSPSGHLILHKLEDFNTFLVNLVPLANRHKRTHPWLTQELDDLIRACVAILVREPESHGAAGIALTLVSSGLDCSSLDRIVLRGLMLRNLVMSFDDPEERPNEDTIRWLEEAQRSVPVLNLIEEQREFASLVLQNAGTLLSIVFLRSYLHEGEQVEAMVHQINVRMGTLINRLGTDRNAIGNVASIITKWCSDVDRVFARLFVITDDADIKNDLTHTRTRAREIQNQMNRYVR